MTAPMQCHNSQKEIAIDAAGMLMPEAPQPSTRKWYFSRKEIECHTPSRSDGIHYKQEQHLQKLYCSFLQELGIELKVFGTTDKVTPSRIRVMETFFLQAAREILCDRKVMDVSHGDSLFAKCKGKAGCKAFLMEFKKDYSRSGVLSASLKEFLVRPQVTIATAVMFCHRFYMRQSHMKNDWQTIATVCMFLACKAEETPRWLGELVVVAYKLIYKWDPSASRRIREIYDKQKELILTGERLLLATIAFDLNIEHPYKSLVAALKRLGITHKELVKVAWNFVNDWLRTSLCLQHKPHYIAAGSLFLAAKVKKVKLPTAKGKAWWMEFDVSPKQLEDVIQQMMSLWEQSQSQTLTLKDQNVTESLIRKATIYSPQSSTLSGSCIVQDSKTVASMDVGGPAKAATSNCVKKQAFDNVLDTFKETINCRIGDSGSAKDITSDCVKKHTFDNVQGTSKETPNCQTSDTSSAVSVVEDGDSGEPVTVKSDLSSSCKIVSVGGIVGNGQVDVNRIREKLKKRNFIKTMKRKRVEDLDDEIDGEAWIERELENGIVLESSYPQKQMKI